VLEVKIARGAIDASVQSTIDPLFQCIEQVLSGEKLRPTACILTVYGAKL
jgi:hypothetical protein